MGKSTHPFVEKMNNAKALHRAMRAGEAKEPKKDEVRSVIESVEDTVNAKAESRRHLTLHRKTPTETPPPKGVLSIVLPK